MSYNGSLGFGLLGDYDALPELEGIARDLEWAIDSLSAAAGVSSPKRAPRRASARKKAGPSPARPANGHRKAPRPAGAG
jgi:hypothetical protein